MLKVINSCINLRKDKKYRFGTSTNLIGMYIIIFDTKF